MPFSLHALAAISKAGSSSSNKYSDRQSDNEIVSEVPPPSGFMGHLKAGLGLIKNGIMNSWKIKLIISFGVLLLICNIALIATNQYNVTSEGSSTWTNAMYLTTTQMTTIGYGDVIPQTDAAKWFSSFAHLVILFLTLGLAEEFGAITVARKNQTKKIETEIKKEFTPLHRRLTRISSGLACQISEVAKEGIEKKFKDGNATAADAFSLQLANDKLQRQVANTADKFMTKLQKNVVKKNNSPVVIPTVNENESTEITGFE